MLHRSLVALLFPLDFPTTPDAGIRTKRLQSSDSSFKRLNSFYVPKFNLSYPRKQLLPV